jgi:hypothetical protein
MLARLAEADEEKMLEVVVAACSPLAPQTEIILGFDSGGEGQQRRQQWKVI